MYVLHTSPETGGFAVQAVLEEAGAEYRLAEVDFAAGLHRSPAFLSLNPMAQVPVLELPEGTVMTESAAIVIYLADRLGPGSLAPAPDSPLRPVFLRWLVFMAANLYPADLMAYHADRYTTDPAGAPAVRQAALDLMDQHFAILDEAIGDRASLIGDGYTVADPYLLMLTYWHPDAAAVLGHRPNIARLCEAVRDRPAVVAANAYHRIW